MHGTNKAQFVSTLETLLLTERIEAIAATAISDTIKVNSTTVAPCWFFIKLRNSDSMRSPISLLSSLQGVRQRFVVANGT
jgi:hypothetical protein